MATSPVDKRPLPKGWVVRESSSRPGRNYYFHIASARSSWKHPLDMSPKDQIAVSSKIMKREKHFETSSTTSSSLEFIAKRRKTSPAVTSDQWSSSSKTDISKKSSSKKSVVRSGGQESSSSKPAKPLTSTALQKHASKDKKGVSKAKEKTLTPPSPVKFACSRTKANHIASWVSNVNHSYEPSEQGSVASDVSRAKCGSESGSVRDLDEGVPRNGAKGNNNSATQMPRPGTSRRNSESSVNTPKQRVRTFSSNSRSTSISPTTPPIGFTPFGQLAYTPTTNNQAKPAVPMNIDTRVVQPAPSDSTSAVNNTFRSSTPESQQTIPPQIHPPVNFQFANGFPEQSQEVTGGSVGSHGIQSPGFVGHVQPSPYVGPGQTDGLCNGQINEQPEQLMFPGQTEGPCNGQTQHDSGYDDTIEMEVDNCEELQASIMAELQEVRSSFIIGPEQMSQESIDSETRHVYSDGLYVILDTNILLSHLKFITELRDFPIEGVGRPVLIVPWIVMQELDSLKSDSWKIKRGKIVNALGKNNRGVDVQARQAVRFLLSCFDAKHPRIRGQTLAEANEHVSNMPEESNDDRILHCCLLFQMKASNGNAVLFSNDQNLCSKAIINGIRAFRSHNIIDGLKDTFQNKELVVRADYFSDYYDQLKVQEKLADRRAKADDIVCELQCVMREGLAVIVETEMRAAYDDLWDTIVCLKPPWTLRDLLQIIDKHWIAVFGDVIKRTFQATIKDLKNQLNPEKGVPGCTTHAAVLLGTARTLFDAFAARSSYNGAVTKCLAAIIVLQKKCKDCREESPTPLPVQKPNSIMPAPQPVYRALPSSHTSVTAASSTAPADEPTPPSSDETASVVSSVQGEINTGSVLQPYEEVLSAFDVIWNAVNQFSAQIFSALSYPHSIPLSTIENLPKPTKEEAVAFLCRLCPCLGSLVAALQHVLRLPIEQLSSEPQSFNNLLNAIATFLHEILSLECKVTSQALCQFCQDPNSRTALIQGLSQLDRALAMLQHCSTCVAQV